MAQAPRVRAATEHDRGSWLHLRHVCCPELGVAQHEAAITRVLAHPFQRAAFVCVDALVQLQGVVEVSRRPWVDGCESGPVGYVEALCISPDADAGLAARLVSAAEDWSRKHGCREMACWASPSTGSEQAACLDLGYREVARLVVYAKPLPSAPRTAPSAPLPGKAPEEGAAAMPLASAGAVASLRPARLVVHTLLWIGGLASIWQTRLWSEDIFYGGVLPLMDIAFLVYAVLLVGLARYRQHTHRTALDGSRNLLHVAERTPTQGGSSRDHGPRQDGS